MADKPDGTYRTRRDVREMQAHPQVEQGDVGNVTFRTPTGRKLVIPGALIVSLGLGVFGGRQWPTQEQEISHKYDRILEKMDDEARDRRRFEEELLQRIGKVETQYSLGQNTMLSMQSRLESCCARAR